jgi:hypothetical protein
MGYNNQYALVSMTNKDVYYLTRAAAKTLMALIAKADAPAFFETVDAKSHSQIAIATKNVSSVVIPDEPGGRYV